MKKEHCQNSTTWLEKCRKVKMTDHYIPASRLHPSIRIRKKDNVYELSRKAPVSKKDLSIQEEINIKLDKDEYDALIKLPAKVVHKIRYYYPCKNLLSKTLLNPTIVKNNKMNKKNKKVAKYHDREKQPQAEIDIFSKVVKICDPPVGGEVNFITCPPIANGNYS